MASEAAKAKAERPAKPKCQNLRHNVNGNRVRCTNDGVACWISGSFGRSPKVLCQRCIGELRTIGWNVRYQIEGDNPPPLGQLCS
jgi:hypothetical protein